MFRIANKTRAAAIITTILLLPGIILFFAAVISGYNNNLPETDPRAWEPIGRGLVAILLLIVGATVGMILMITASISDSHAHKAVKAPAEPDNG